MSFHFILMGILLDGLCIVVRMAFGYVHDLKYVLRLLLLFSLLVQVYTLKLMGMCVLLLMNIRKKNSIFCEIS